MLNGKISSQTMHIVAESIVVVGVAVWLNRKVKESNARIDKLEAELANISRLLSAMANQPPRALAPPARNDESREEFAPAERPRGRQRVSPPSRRNQPRSRAPPRHDQPRRRPPPQGSPMRKQKRKSDSFTTSDLDRDLADELRKLDEEEVEKSRLSDESDSDSDSSDSDDESD